MILTGSKIRESILSGDITIQPFDKKMINPNSYNYHLGKTIKVYEEGRFEELRIPEEGLVIQPHTLYLANTLEVIGSNKFAMSLIGKSSMGRLGLFLQVSANLGHTGSCHRWTLELVATKAIRLFPCMIIGQVSFWNNSGKVELNNKGYAKFSSIKESNQEL